VCRRPWCLRRESREWQIAALNLLGSLLFMAAALAAFVLPSTGDPLDASLANSGTLTGALCFLVGARLLTRTDAVRPPASAGEIRPTVR
jgi:peptidoglycan/LPS O-acetylase OafA/YrhL